MRCSDICIYATLVSQQNTAAIHCALIQNSEHYSLLRTRIIKPNTAQTMETTYAAQKQNTNRINGAGPTPVLTTKITNQLPDPLTTQNIAQALWMKTYDESKIPSDILARIHSAKNSNAAFGTRFRTRLQQLMNNPLSFVVPRTDRYKYLLQHSDFLSAQQFYTRNLMLGPESVTGYAAIPLDPKLLFPAIDAPQLQNQVGWHFFVGNFTDAANNHYSVEMMFWQYTQLPPAIAASFGLSDIENQTFEVHLAICDPQQQKQYRANTPVVAGTTGLGAFTQTPYHYQIGKNSIRGLNDNGDLFPATIHAKGFDMRNEADIQEIGIDITLDNIKGMFLQGDGGCSPSIDGIGTLYYSAAQLGLKAGHSSTITINGNTIALTDGSMWYDHQWGTGFMPTGAPQHAVLRAANNTAAPAVGGWDWFMLQFHKNDAISKTSEVQITLSALHSQANKPFYYQTGPTAPGTMTAKMNGKYIDPNNNAIEISGELTVSEWVKVTESPNPDVFPATNTWYPARYEMALQGNMPDLLKNVVMTPLIATGQTGFFGNGLQYTEGGAVITNPDGVEIGRGFAEGTGWANCNAGIVALAGLPVDDFTLGLLKAPIPSAILKLLSTIWVLLRGAELQKILKEARGFYP